MKQLQILNNFSGDPINGFTEIYYESTRQIPNALNYSVKRYVKPPGFEMEDAGLLKYHVESSDSGKNHLELLFCISANRYCDHSRDCENCPVHGHLNCTANYESLDVMQFVFTSSVLQQYSQSRTSTNNLSENIIAFKHRQNITRSFPLCGKARQLLNGLLNHNFSDCVENIYVNAQSQLLLLYSLDCLDDKEPEFFTCKFLSNDEDRQKIIKAREILLNNLGEPVTIKALSRKVGINECYLKKGFRELFGITIFEFYQSQRMEHAKYLLYEKGLTVTEVSMLLGYSSISHFSTAFKKHTGLKPCELLLR
jgi:AraC family transcriptional regulator